MVPLLIPPQDANFDRVHSMTSKMQVLKRIKNWSEPDFNARSSFQLESVSRSVLIIFDA